MRFRRRRQVEPRHMGKNDGVGLGVRQAEPAEHVRELVLQRRPGGEHGAGQPRRDQAFRARIAVRAVGDHPRQMHGETARSVGGERHQERRAVGHPEPLDAVGDGVHGAGGAHRGGQTESQVRIVDDGARQDARILAGELALALAHSPDRGRFGSGIGGRHGEDGQCAIARDDLGQPDRRAAAGRHQTVGIGRRCEARFRHRLGHVHHRLRMQPGRTRAQNIDQPRAEPRTAPGRGDHQGTAHAEARRFVGNARDRAGREHDALGLDFVNERCGHQLLDASGPPWLDATDYCALPACVSQSRRCEMRTGARTRKEHGARLNPEGTTNVGNGV